MKSRFGRLVIVGKGGWRRFGVVIAVALFFGLLLAGPAAGSWRAGAAEAAGPGGQVGGTLPAGQSGTYAYHRIDYPGDGSLADLRLEVATANKDTIRATGIIVYGPTKGREYAKSPVDGGNSRTAAFTATEQGQYTVQVFNYSPFAVGYTLSANRPLDAAAGGRVVAIDPGHGGREIGATTPNGDRLEKNVNLAIANKLADRLRADGIQAVLTRDSDRSVLPGAWRGTQDDLQARVDAANAAKADLFICIHNNGGPSSESGTEVWYNHARPFADRNLALARLVQAKLLDQLRALGYPTRDRGIKDDSHFRVVGRVSYNIYVLAPGTWPVNHPPTQMPGVLGESLFMGDPADANMLRQDRTLNAIAQGYHDAILEYFAAFPR